MAEARLEAPTAQPETHDAHPLPWVARHNGLRKFTVDEFYRMTHLGILGAGERLELLDGYLVNIMAPNPPHSTAVYWIYRRLDRAVPDGWFVRSENPIRLDLSAPMPDVCVVRGHPNQFATVHPTPVAIALIVEVADSTLAIDRKAKVRIYARNGIAEYWIVNLDEEQIEVYTEPQPQAETPHYLKRVVYKFGDNVPFRLDGKLLTEVAVEEVFPRPSPADGGE